MIRLSVNVNKVATLRNSRGGTVPRVLDAVAVCLAAGAGGITVHPRADRRHITPQDVRDIARALQGRPNGVEYNIEGDPRPDLVDLVCKIRPDQCTLVPVVPGEVTSQAGWTAANSGNLSPVIARLKEAGIRVSLFVEPQTDAVRLAASLGADRVELYTEPYARAFEQSADAAAHSFETYRRAALAAERLGLGVNAGHDLDLGNLELFRTLPHLQEVSIGHALMSRALFVGLERTVRDFVSVLSL